MQRNIRLIKITSTLNNSWFWLGIWLLYYLRYTDYKGVGIIEMVAFVNSLIMEVPTGAISDLIGKRKSMIIGYLLSATGNIAMGLSTSLAGLVFSVFLMGPGSGLISGTKEALIYDSLKQLKKDNDYEKVLAKVNKYQLLGLATASIIGGFIYKLSPQLPFFITGFVMLIASALSLLYIEPDIDSEKFSLNNFIKQNTVGFRYIFKTVFKNQLLLLVLLFSAFAHMVTQVYDNALAIEFGFSEDKQGILFAIITLGSAFGYHYYSTIKAKIGINNTFALMLFTLIITILVSPMVGIFLGGLTIFSRNIFSGYSDILATDLINKNISSRVRATTISTYYMFVGFPYAISAYFIGGFIDRLTPIISLVVLTLGFIVLNFIVFIFFKYKNVLRQFLVKF